MSVCQSCGAMRLEQWTTCPFCRFKTETATAAVAPTVDSGVAVHTSLPAGSEHTDSPAGDAASPDAAATDSPAPDAAATDSPAPDAAATDSPAPNDETPVAFDLAELSALVEEDGPEPSREMPAPLIAAIALVVALLFGALAVLFVGGDDDSRPQNLAMTNDTTSATDLDLAGVQADATETSDPGPEEGATPTSEDSSEPSAPMGPTLSAELAPQFRAICAGEQPSIPGAATPGVADFNDVITVTLDTTTGVWSDPSTQVAYSTAVPTLVRCDTTTDAEPIYFCDDYEDGFSYTGVATDWSTRLIQTSDGAVLAETSGRNENVGDCPDTLTVYDDNKAVVERAGADATAPAAIALFPTAASFACAPNTEPNGLLALAANDPAQIVPIPDTWPGTPNSLGATTLCLGQRAELGTDELCRTIVVATALDAAGGFLGAWSYTHGNCDWTGGPPMPPVEWFRNVVGPALGYLPA